MITSIGGVKMPPSVKSKSEIVPNVTTRRTVNGRLIVKHLYDAWQCSFEMDDGTTMRPEYQATFYGLCLAARTEPVTVTFISPYDGEEHSIDMICTEVGAPSTIGLLGRKPHLYSGISATFEEANP